MIHTNELPEPNDTPEYPFDSPEQQDLEDVSDETLELAAYLGTPEVQALCQHLGPDGADIVKASFRDGFNAGATAFEDAMNRLDFDHYVVLTEQSGCHHGERISLRLTLLDRQLYCSEGYNHNRQERFDTANLSAATMQYLRSIVAVHNQQGPLPVPTITEDDAQATDQK